MIDLVNVETLRSSTGSFAVRSGFDTGGQRWLEYTVSESKEESTYALVGISEARYQGFLDNRITLRSFYEEPESGTVYRVVRRWDVDSPHKKAYVESIKASEVGVRFDSLPKHGVYANLG